MYTVLHWLIYVLNSLTMPCIIVLCLKNNTNFVIYILKWRKVNVIVKTIYALLYSLTHTLPPSYTQARISKVWVFIVQVQAEYFVALAYQSMMPSKHNTTHLTTFAMGVQHKMSVWLTGTQCSSDLCSVCPQPWCHHTSAGGSRGTRICPRQCRLQRQHQSVPQQDPT